MRIRVSGEGRDINICIPTTLIFNGITAEIATLCLRRSAPDQLNQLSSRQMRSLFSEFRRIKDKHGSWELIDVQSSDGEIVKIIL